MKNTRYIIMYSMDLKFSQGDNRLSNTS